MQPIFRTSRASRPKLWWPSFVKVHIRKAEVHQTPKTIIAGSSDRFPSNTHHKQF